MKTSGSLQTRICLEMREPELLIISGGQTGVDQAGWRAAKSLGIATGGWMPRGFRTEDGPRPEFAELYNAHACNQKNYNYRTEINVVSSQITIWYGRGDTGGYWCTKNAANRHYRAFCDATLLKPELVARTVKIKGVWSINVAGNRESVSPGVGADAEAYFKELFEIIKNA